MPCRMRGIPVTICQWPLSFPIDHRKDGEKKADEWPCSQAELCMYLGMIELMPIKWTQQKPAEQWTTNVQYKFMQQNHSEDEL